MTRYSESLAGLMLAVALVALDLGLLVNGAFGSNPFQVITVIVVEVDLFRAFARVGKGRAWWLGFAVCGLVFAALDVTYHYEIRYAMAYVARQCALCASVCGPQTIVTIAAAKATMKPVYCGS